MVDWLMTEVQCDGATNFMVLGLMIQMFCLGAIIGMHVVGRMYSK